MEVVYLLAALALLVSLVASLARVVLGPSDTDRMLAAQIIGTTGVAILLLLARVSSAALLDVALVFAPLAAVAAVAFVRRTTQAGAGEGGPRP
jgi:multicomponent Na+:H+ antiporter subunit F